MKNIRHWLSKSMNDEEGLGEAAGVELGFVAGQGTRTQGILETRAQVTRKMQKPAQN